MLEVPTPSAHPVSAASWELIAPLIVRVVIHADSSLQDSAGIDLIDPKDNGRHIHVAMGMAGGRAGGIWSITKDLAPGELPDAVTKSIGARYPGAQITSASVEFAAGILNSCDVTFRPTTGKPRGMSCGAEGEIYRDFEWPAGPKMPTTAPATQRAE